MKHQMVWIAVEQNGEVWLFARTKPYRLDGEWVHRVGAAIEITDFIEPDSAISRMTWSDEPLLVSHIEVVLKDEAPAAVNSQGLVEGDVAVAERSIPTNIAESIPDCNTGASA